jgi:hypothetical protein
MAVEMDISLWTITDLTQRLIESAQPDLVHVGLLLQQFFWELERVAEANGELEARCALYYKLLTDTLAMNDRLRAVLHAHGLDAEENTYL